MNTRAHSMQVWRATHRKVAAASGAVTIQKTPWFPHPRDAGAQPTTTWPVGQAADYLLELEADLAPLLIREFSDRYEAFLAGARFTARLLKYLENNPAAATHVGSALVGAMLGAAMTKNRQGALIGAGVGVLVAALIYSQHLKTQELNASPSL